MLEVWRALPARLALVAVWSTRERRSRYRQTYLATYWTLVFPAATLVIYGWMFSVVLRVNSDGLPYLSFAFAGLVPWIFTASALTLACSSIVHASATISSVRFPREVIPLGAIAGHAGESAITVFALLAVAVVQGVGLSVTLLALPVVALVLVAWVAALGLFLGSLTVFVRDIRHGLPLLLQLWFISTPVMYPRSLFPDRFDWVAAINPMAVVVEATRDAVLRHVWPQWPDLLAHGVAGAVVFALALAYFRSVEIRFAEVA